MKDLLRMVQSMSDIPRLPGMGTGSHRQVKTSISMDADVHEWYASGGRGLQTRLNFALRWFMEEYQRQHGSTAKPAESVEKGNTKP